MSVLSDLLKKLGWKTITIIVLSIALVITAGVFINVQKGNSAAVAVLNSKLGLLGQQLDSSELITRQLRVENKQLNTKLTAANELSNKLAGQLAAANIDLAVIADKLKLSGKLSDDLKKQLIAANANIADISGQLARSQQYSDELAKQLGESNAKLELIKSAAANISTDSTDAKSIIGQLRFVFKQLQDAFDGS